MQESVIYQDILQKGLHQGLQQGELAVVVRLLTRRLGTIPSEVEVLFKKSRDVAVQRLY